MDRACGACAFFDGQARCKRYPKVFVFAEAQQGPGLMLGGKQVAAANIRLHFDYPAVRAEDWCGEFIPRADVMLEKDGGE